MAQVSYALREDPNSIFLLQDAGRHYNKYCQITVFGRNIIRPEFFRQYLFFAPYIGSNGKYHGSATDLLMSIEDNGFTPFQNYVALIDSEVEFKISSTVISQLSKNHMPAWGVKSYLDYFVDRKSGILLFLRVYRVNQALHHSYLEKGVRGSSQILKLYDEVGEETSITVDGLEPVISDNKFSYLKDEILHLLKVEDAFIALYDNTENGLNSLQERVIADRQIQGTHKRWEARHLGWLENDSEEDDDFDMAQLDYEAIYREVLDVCPGMEGIINYARSIRPARLGEYDHYLNNIHLSSQDALASRERLFEMSLRAAVKTALQSHKKNHMDLEDAFQEDCIGILMAIQKYNDNVSGLFPSYVAMWMRQIMDRNLSTYEYNVRVPVHYRERIKRVLQQLSGKWTFDDLLNTSFDELYNLLLNNTDCNREEALRIAYILCPSMSIETLINDSCENGLPLDEDVFFDESFDPKLIKDIRGAMASLTDKERVVLFLRFGFDGQEERTLESVGSILSLTRERIRQIENKAMHKIVVYYRNNHLLSAEQLSKIKTINNDKETKDKKKYKQRVSETKKRKKNKTRS